MRSENIFLFLIDIHWQLVFFNILFYNVKEVSKQSARNEQRMTIRERKIAHMAPNLKQESS